MRILQQYLRAAQLLACSCFLLCVCVAIPSVAQITLTRPSAGDRIISQGQYTIQWTGTSPNDTVRIEFSRDNGKSWQLITASATGNQFVWNPVPVINSETCLIRIASRSVDATPFTISNRFNITYGANKSERTARSRFASFSPDGTKILAFANNFNSVSPDDTNQIYQVQVWDANTGKLLYILSSYIVNPRTFPVPRWQWNDNSVPWLRFWWSPDSRYIVSPVLTDTTFGIYDTQTTNGQPIKTFNLPRLGKQRVLRQLRWSTDGNQILANVLYQPTNSDSVLTALVRFNPISGATIGSVALALRETTPLEIVSFAGFSNDATRWITSHQNRISGDITRFTVYSTVTGNIVNSLSPPTNYRWRQYPASPYQGLWSPNDSLLALVSEPATGNTNLGAIPEISIVKTFTGEIFRSISTRPTPEPITWSTDSRSLLLWNGLDENSRDIYHVQTGRIEINFRFSDISITRFPGAGAFNINPYNVSWSNNMKRIAGYVTPFDPQSPTLGIWDAELGCLLQTVKLPLTLTNSDIAAPFKWTGFVSWSNDDSRLMLQNFSSDTTLIIPIPNFISPCKQGGADSAFIIQPRTDFVVQEIIAFPAIVCQTTSTLNIPIRNVSPVGQFFRIRLENVNPENSLNPVQDFILQSPSQQQLSSGQNGNVSVQFTPSFSGRKTAYLTFDFGVNTAPIRSLLVAVKDTIDILPSSPILDFGFVSANTSTSASIILKNTGTTAILWNTNATFSTNGQFWVESFSPSTTLPNQQSTAVVRFTGVPTPQIINDSLSLFRCLNRTFPLRIKANILPDVPKIQLQNTFTFTPILCPTATEESLTIRNVGGKRLEIFDGLISGNDFRTVGTRFPVTLAPFDSLQLRVIFEPRMTGITTATMTIFSNDATSNITSINLQAEKRSLQYTVRDSVIEFDNVPEGTQSVQSTVFTNSTSGTLFWNMLPINITNDIVLERVNPSPTGVSNSAELFFRFLGRKDRVEFITSGVVILNDICSTPIPLQFRIRVGEPRPRLVVPPSVGFNTIACTRSSTLATVLLQNNGGRALRIDSLIVRSPNSLQADSAFRILNVSLPILLQAQGSAAKADEFALQLAFEPRTLGYKEALLQIYSNDSTTTTNGIQRVLLSGERDSIGFTLDRNAVNFFTPNENVPAFDTLQITNNGTVPLTWGAFPRRVSEQFSIEKIEPNPTPISGTSRLTVRFSGSVFGISTLQNFTLSPLQCSERSQSLSLRAIVGKQASINVPSVASQRFVCEGVQNVSIPLQNTGSETLTLDIPQILSDANTFRLVRFPAMIRAGERDSIVIALQSRVVGTYTGRVRIPSNAVNMALAEVSLSISKDSSGLRVIPALADVGNLAEQTSTTQTIIVENTGNIPQTLTLPRQRGVFSFNWQGADASASTLVLQPNARLQVNIAFSASAGGVYTDTLSLQDSCGTVLRLPIIARVISGQIFLPDTIQMGQSQELSIPITIRSRKGISTGVLTSFRLSIGNASLLEVRSPQAMRSRVENGVRILHFTAQVSSDIDSEPVLRIGLRGLLGNDTRTAITIDSAFSGGVAIRGSVSQFQAVGGNSSGGKRLYFTPPVQLTTLSPNPAQNGVSLTLNVVERVSVQVFIVDVLGKRTFMTERDLEQGDHTVFCTLSNFASGVYSVEILANGTRQTGRIHVLR